MDDLARWLGEQLDEDQRIAREAGGLAWSRPEDPGDPAAIRDSEQERVVCDEGWPSEGQEVHIAEWDPARVLREIDAKREIVRAYQAAVAGRDDVEVGTDGYHRSVGTVTSLRRVICLLVTAYEDRPGFKEEWRP